MSRYRFALRPKWIFSHLFVLALVSAMLWAGFWQLNRLQQKKDRNARVEARTAEPALTDAGLPAPGAFDAANAVEFRRVRVTGTYQVDQEVLVRSRSFESSPGSWVLSPLTLADGTAVVVNRGWIPNPGDIRSVPAAYRAPTGRVTVSGLARLTETRGRFGSTDPGSGVLTDLARADIARLDAQVPEDLRPMWVQLTTQRPAAARLPRPVPPPELDEGPHFSYAMQWFIFTTVAVVGYPLILHRRAGEVAIEELGDPEEGSAPPDPNPDLDPAPGDD